MEIIVKPETSVIDKLGKIDSKESHPLTKGFLKKSFAGRSLA
jgi:hypothetical protein